MNRLWIIIAAGVSVGILALGWFIGVSPKLDELGVAEQQLATVEQQNKIHEQRLAALEADNARLAEFRVELAELQIQLPPGDDLSTFVGLLHDLEESSGVTVARISPQNGVPYKPSPSAIKTSNLVSDGNFIVIPIELGVEGTRAQVLAFVSDLQFGENQRLFLVRDLTISQTSGSSSRGAYSGTIAGFVYVLVDPSAPPPAPTPEKPAAPPTETDTEG